MGNVCIEYNVRGAVLIYKNIVYMFVYELYSCIANIIIFA